MTWTEYKAYFKFNFIAIVVAVNEHVQFLTISSLKLSDIGHDLHLLAVGNC